MTYIAKPKLANNIGVKEFKTAAEAIVYLATFGVETHGVNEAEKVEELGWIDKLKVAAQMHDFWLGACWGAVCACVLIALVIFFL